MNKMVKGSAAGAAGIVLLMGGFGTYALWTDTAAANSGQIQSGALDITGTGAPTWADVSTVGSTGASWNPSTDAMVPGDKVALTQPVTINAVGKNLKVKFDVTGIDKGTWSNLGVSMTYGGQSLSAVSPQPTGGPEYTFTYNAASSIAGTKNLVVTFDFPNDVTGTADQNKTVSLASVGVAVSQVRS